jgi:chromosome segregation ATPase
MPSNSQIEPNYVAIGTIITIAGCFFLWSHRRRQGVAEQQSKEVQERKLNSEATVSNNSLRGSTLINVSIVKTNIEALQAKINSISEQLSQNKIDNDHLRKELGSIGESVKQISSQMRTITEIAKDVTEIKESVEKLIVGVKYLDESIKEIKGTVDGIEETVNSINELMSTLLLLVGGGLLFYMHTANVRPLRF